MKKPPDILARVSDPQRAAAMERLVKTLFGPKNGETIWKQMDATMRVEARQLGDHPEPEKNYWRGAWRIYDLE